MEAAGLLAPFSVRGALSAALSAALAKCAALASVQMPSLVLPLATPLWFWFVLVHLARKRLTVTRSPRRRSCAR